MQFATAVKERDASAMGKRERRVAGGRVSLRPAVQQELAGMTGITTVPQVFVRGSFFGTCDGTRAAIANGELAKRLAQ